MKLGESLSLSSILQNPKIRSLIISVAGRVFHHLYGKRHAYGVNFLLSSRDMRLAVTALNFLTSSGIHVQKPGNVSYNIHKLRDAGRGLIIGTHTTGIFIDYLPLFAELGDDVLKKCIFYTGEYNLPMNQREFPDYQFRAVPEGHQTGLAKGFRERLQEDAKKVKANGGYIFLMPGGGGKDNGQDFKAIFSTLIAELEDDFPVLAFHTSIDVPGLQSYLGLLEQRISGGERKRTIGLSTHMNSVVDWKNMQARKYYNVLFGIKNPPSE